MISHVKALGLYNFIREFGWAYKRQRGGEGRGVINGEGAYKLNKIVLERRDITYPRNELKLTYHNI